MRLLYQLTVERRIVHRQKVSLIIEANGLLVFCRITPPCLSRPHTPLSIQHLPWNFVSSPPPSRPYTCKMAANVPPGFLSKSDMNTIVTDYGRTFDLEKCPAGTYTDAVRSPAHGTACFPCPAGKYGATTGLTTNACSGPCDAGYYCPAGETDKIGVKCPAGAWKRLSWES